MAGKVQCDLLEQTFNYWKVIEYLGKSKYKCECLQCGYEREIDGYFLLNNTIPKCEHEKTKITDLTGVKFGDWKVISEVKRESMKTADGKKVKRKWLCECKCGNTKEVLQYSLTNGKSTGCGHDTNKQFIDLTGKTFGDWKVLEYNKQTLRWICQCSCDKIAELTGYQLRNGLSSSCGHSTTGFKDITKMMFGEWEVIRKSPIQMENGVTFWECKCSCGTIRDISSYVLRNGVSKSCGCKSNELREETCISKYGVKHPSQVDTKRTKEQLEMIDTKDKLISVIKNNFKDKPSIYELSLILGISRGSTKVAILKYGLEDYVVFGIRQSSGYEKAIDALFPCTNKSDKTVLNGKELDLYYPEHKFAIEFNGNYWHSELKKDKTYHQEKTLSAYKKGIQVFHIFEYEWNNNDTKEKIINLIRNKLYGDRLQIIQARKCEILEIKNNEANEFIEKYHLQGKATASISIGIFYENELIGVTTFGKPRFDKEYEYELVRLAWKTNVAVTGGAERLFSYFIKRYTPISIISYCDISKFSGNVYTKLGFRVNKITEPNYKWVDVETNEVLPRYKTTKQRLIDAGLGTPEETEVEIMHKLGYLRVFDSGNLKLVWES